MGPESGIGIELELTTTQYVFLKSLKSWLRWNRRQDLPASPWDGSLNKSSDLRFALWATFNGENWGGSTWSQCQPYIKLGPQGKWFLASSLPPQALYLPFLRLPSLSEPTGPLRLSSTESVHITTSFSHLIHTSSPPSSQSCTGAQVHK